MRCTQLLPSLLVCPFHWMYLDSVCVFTFTCLMGTSWPRLRASGSRWWALRSLSATPVPRSADSNHSSSWFIVCQTNVNCFHHCWLHGDSQAGPSSSLMSLCSASFLSLFQALRLTFRRPGSPSYILHTLYVCFSAFVPYLCDSDSGTAYLPFLCIDKKQLRPLIKILSHARLVFASRKQIHLDTFTDCRWPNLKTLRSSVSFSCGPCSVFFYKLKRENKMFSDL